MPLTVRRPVYEPDYTKRAEVAQTPVPFSLVDRGSTFYIQPHKYIGLAFIKTHPTGAQVDDPSNGSMFMDQYFPDDFPVYPVTRPDKRVR